MTRLEQEVLDIIEETTCTKYIGKLRVTVLRDKLECGDCCKELHAPIYELRLYLDRWFTPIVFSYEGTEKEFKDFLREEFKNRKLEKTGFYKVTLEPFVPDIELTDDWDE